MAAADLGMHPTYLDPTGSQIGKKESIADTARVLGRMYDGIEYRGYGQAIVEELAKYAGVPVWNGLTNEFHPTQILADFLTIKEHFGTLEGIKLVYMGDARYNMGTSEIIDALRQGHVSYVINTIDINQHNTRLDGYEIRRTAVENNVTVFTALETVRVLLDVLEEITLRVSTIDAK